jgi:hypothetical protein
VRLDEGANDADQMLWVDKQTAAVEVELEQRVDP